MLLRDIVKKYITRKDTVLDLCCGIGYAFKDSNWGSLIGVDIYENYLHEFRDSLKRVSVVQGNVCNIFNLMRGPFDIITCFDAVEHLNKEEATNIINWMSSNSKKYAMVLTPKDFIENPKKDVWQGGDEYQEHKCHFSVEEMMALGFSVEHYFRKSKNFLYLWPKATIKLPKCKKKRIQKNHVGRYI